MPEDSGSMLASRSDSDDESPYGDGQGSVPESSEPSLSAGPQQRQRSVGLPPESPAVAGPAGGSAAPSAAPVAEAGQLLLQTARSQGGSSQTSGSTLPHAAGAWQLQQEGEESWYGGVSKCGKWNYIVGGFNKAGRGKHLENTYTVPDNAQVRIELDFLKIDNWADGDAANVYVDDKLCWSKQDFDNNQGEPICGQRPYNEQSELVQCDATTDGVKLNVKVNTTLTVAESQASFGIRNAKLFIYRELCPAAICAVGTTLKPDSPLCKPSCTQEVCCDHLGRCSPAVCPPGLIMRAKPPKYCSDTACSEDECCEELPECDRSICRADEGYTPKDSFPPFCPHRHCEPEDCCDELGKCSQELCSTSVSGHTLKPHHPNHCKAPSCTVDECCDALPFCQPSDCNLRLGITPRLSLASGLQCKGAKCQAHECCTALPTCTPEICPEGTAFKEEPPAFCLKLTCTRQECCDGLPTCTNDVCGAAGKGMLEDLPEYCEGMACTLKECCQAVRFKALLWVFVVVVVRGFVDIAAD